MNNNLRERIRILIGAMGDDEFERFMSELLPRIYPGFEALEPSFNFIGKTTKGKCDAHVYHAAEDNYTAIICTTRQSDVHAKVLDDINKLAATKFSSKIRRVLLCINTPVKDEVEEYRAACKSRGWELEPVSLERITLHTIAEDSLLRSYFNELTDSSSSLNTSIVRRFDCGLRIKEAREDLLLPISQLIEELNFPSEREWGLIEATEIEVGEKHINGISALGGISTSWVKHGATPKYPTETIYDYQLDKVDAIAHELPLATYMAIHPDSMEMVMVVQFSRYRWRVYSFGFSMDFWDWVGDEYHISVIYDLLSRVRQVLKHPYGRIISKALLDEFLSGVHHPSRLIKEAGRNSYWFDDLFDLNHQFPIAKDGYGHHGKWFVQLQKYFSRLY